MNKFPLFISFILFSFVTFIGVHSLQCYKCQSDTDPGCVLAETTHIRLWEHEKCDDDVKDCASWILEGDPVTYRGCKDPKKEYSEIDECKEDFCNYQVFPKDRLSCYKCGPTGCNTITEFQKVKLCLNYAKDDMCYTIVLNETDTYRGCHSDTNTTGIDFCKNETMAENCVLAKLNNENSLLSPLKCVQCDKSELTVPFPPYLLCYENPTSSDCNKMLLGHAPDKCFTIQSDEYIKKGCLHKDSNEEECEAAKDRCTTCPSTSCNSKLYPGIKCRKCDSTDDEKCKDDPDTYVHCVSDKEDELMGCVLIDEEVNGVRHVARGCLHSITNATLKESCINQSDTCKSCFKKGCNNKVTYQKCFECDSTVEPNCATLKDTSKLKAVTCTDYDDECFSQIGGDDDYGTQRGCVSHLTNITQRYPYFTKCKENNCNILPVPSFRIRCFQCDESKNENCQISDTETPPLHYCRNFDPDNTFEECYTMVDKNTKKMKRGCIIDLTEEDVCDEVTCAKCSFDGCNKQPRFSQSELFCINCESSTNNQSCLWGQNDTKAERCKGIVELGTAESCFTATNGDVVKRGCLLDSQDACSNMNSCKTCNLSGCNKENIIKQSCIICDSLTDPDCATDEPYVTMSECPTEVQVFEERWCYTLKDEKRNGTIHRGCLSELTDDLKEICLDKNNHFCDICDAAGCNNKKPPNSSMKLLLMNMIWMIGLISFLIILS